MPRKPTSNLDLLSKDIDWFALDLDGMLGHFTTGGRSPMPQSVIDHNADRVKLYRYFDALPPSSSVIRSRDPSGLKMAEGYSIDDYFHSSAAMSSKGLFSFDTVDPSGDYPQPYILATIPEVPLVYAALPKRTQLILSRFRLSIRFAQVKTFDFTD